jgi:hypothetical protein
VTGVGSPSEPVVNERLVVDDGTTGVEIPSRPIVYDVDVVWLEVAAIGTTGVGRPSVPYVVDDGATEVDNPWEPVMSLMLELVADGTIGVVIPSVPVE